MSTNKVYETMNQIYTVKVVLELSFSGFSLPIGTTLFGIGQLYIFQIYTIKKKSVSPKWLYRL